MKLHNIVCITFILHDFDLSLSLSSSFPVDYYLQYFRAYTSENVNDEKLARFHYSIYKNANHDLFSIFFFIHKSYMRLTISRQISTCLYIKQQIKLTQLNFITEKLELKTVYVIIGKDILPWLSFQNLYRNFLIITFFFQLEIFIFKS